MQKCEEVWANNKVKAEIEKHKKIFMEPKDPSKY
jgi:Rad3-related DNA helicase